MGPIIQKNFTNIYFYNFKGYGTIIEKLLIKFFFNKHYLFRDFYKREYLSSIGKTRFKDHKDIYLETSKLLDSFYKDIPEEYFLYKDINLAKVARRDLHLNLSELLNNIEQLKTYQIKENVIYKVEYKFFKLLNSNNIKCKVSLFLTLLYTSLDFIYSIVIRNRKNESNIIFDTTLKIKESNNISKKNILAVFSLRSSNTTFLKLMDEIGENFNCFWVKPEIEKPFDKKFTKIYKDKALNINPEKKHYRAGELLKCLKNSNKLNEYIHQYISEKLFIIFLQNHKSYKKVIDILDETEKQINLDGILVGLNANWIYNICIQLSKKRNIRSIYFQDLFMHEDTFHDVNADITLTSSNKIRQDLIKFFKKENNEIIVSKEFSKFYPKTPFDLPNLIKKDSTNSIEIFKKNLGIDLNKKIALFIGDPGELYNSKEHKYMDEYNFLDSLKSNEEYFSIVKKHPSDTSNISNIALSDSNNHDAIVSDQIDIYEALISSDVVVSQSSTAVLEAIILKKFIILSNNLSTNFYKNAVEYGVAHYVFDSSDFLQLLDKKDFYMLNYEDKMNKYLDEVYSSDETKVNTSAIINMAINE